jgi:hypothetical protein
MCARAHLRQHPENTWSRGACDPTRSARAKWALFWRVWSASSAIWAASGSVAEAVTRPDAIVTDHTLR